MARPLKKKERGGEGRRDGVSQDAEDFSSSILSKLTEATMKTANSSGKWGRSILRRAQGKSSPT